MNDTQNEVIQGKAKPTPAFQNQSLFSGYQSDGNPIQEAASPDYLYFDGA